MINELIISKDTQETIHRVCINSDYLTEREKKCLIESDNKKITKKELLDILKEKQDKLTAGDGIKLDEDTDVISVSVDKIELGDITDLTSIYLLASE